jgi:hypothetical protein
MALGRALKEAGRPQRAAEIYKAVTKLEVRVGEWCVGVVKVQE